jgi:F-type H+-transporting ATPase subunit b
MLIDWFTVFAQVINFLLLVYLLKRFLYGRIINAMDEREKIIALGLEEAQRKKDDAQQEMEHYIAKNREFDDNRQASLADMKEEVEAQRKELMNEARKQVDKVRADWYEAVEREKQTFLHDLRQRAGKHTCEIARRGLRDLSNVDLEHHIIRVFIERLRNLDGQELQALKEAVSKSGGKLKLWSAFEIPQELATEIVDALKVHIAEPFLRFEASPEVLCGIELELHGLKIAWSLADYLDTLEARLLAALEGGGQKAE